MKAQLLFANIAGLVSDAWDKMFDHTQRPTHPKIEKHSTRIHHIAGFIPASNTRRNNNHRASAYQEHKPFRPIRHVAKK